MKTNIVMLVKDRPRLTEQTLRTLYQNTPKGAFNLTIVDDSSKLFVFEMADEWTRQQTSDEDLSIIRIVTSKGITGQARNLGVYWAEKYWGRGDWLCLVDNDLYFTPGWLDKLTGIAENTELAGFRLWGGWNHPFLQSQKEYSSPTNKGAILKTHDAVTGASQLMRWETWDKFGPLDAHARGVGQSEDWLFCQKIIKDGGRVGSIYPRVVLNAGITNSFGQPSPGADLMLKELVEAKKQYPDLTWE